MKPINELYEKVGIISILLHELEWSGSERGQGSGYMSSGGDGPLIRACPICRGIDPSDRLAHSHFMGSAHGHRPDCKLSKALTLYKEAIG